MYYYENEPHKYQGVNKKELAKRIQKINEIKELISGELTKEYRSVENNQASLAAQQEQERYERGEDGEFDQTRELDNRQVLSLQK